MKKEYFYAHYALDICMHEAYNSTIAFAELRLHKGKDEGG